VTQQRKVPAKDQKMVLENVSLILQLAFKKNHCRSEIKTIIHSQFAMFSKPNADGCLAVCSAGASFEVGAVRVNHKALFIIADEFEKLCERVHSVFQRSMIAQLAPDRSQCVLQRGDLCAVAQRNK
jgi:hypothetical protein